MRPWQKTPPPPAANHARHGNNDKTHPPMPAQPRHRAFGCPAVHAARRQPRPRPPGKTVRGRPRAAAYTMIYPLDCARTYSISSRSICLHSSAGPGSVRPVPARNAST